ncbi:MAG: DUF3418 domain-containing protein, partial [Microbacterium gubbeenense]
APGPAPPPHRAPGHRAWPLAPAPAAGLTALGGGRIPLPEHADERLVRARRLLEELRVGLYAQQLGTAETVSVQRIAKALA